MTRWASPVEKGKGGGVMRTIAELSAFTTTPAGNGEEEE
jgi:hypothetical protein